MSYNQVGSWWDPTSSDSAGTNEVVVKDEIPGTASPSVSVTGTVGGGASTIGTMVGNAGASFSNALNSLFSSASNVVKNVVKPNTPIVADTSATPPTAGSGGFLDSKIVGIPMPVALVGVAITAYYFKSKKKRRGRRR